MKKIFTLFKNIILTVMILFGLFAYVILGIVGYEYVLKPELEYRKELRAKVEEQEKKNLDDKENRDKQNNNTSESNTDNENTSNGETTSEENISTIENSVLDINEVADSKLVKLSDYSNIKSADYFKYNKIWMFDSVGQKYRDYAYTGESFIKAGTLKKLIKVDEELKSKGYILVIWVAYRDNDLQEKLRQHLEITEGITDGRYDLVAAPGTSWHQFGTAVDVTLEKLDGTSLDMPSKYLDFSGNRLPTNHKNNVHLKALQEAMVNNGMEIYMGEWWHFNDKTKKYD